MDSALAWVGQIAAWVGQWFPRWIVVPPTGAMIKCEGFFLPQRWRRYQGAMRITTCPPGMHWYWPATTAIDNYPTVLQTDNLPSQTLETQDGVQAVVSGMITYTVEDVEALLTRNHSAVKTIQALTLAAVHDVCCNMAWDVLKSEQRRGTLDTKLRHAAQRPLKEFGVVVSKCMLTDLARTRVIRLIQSTQQDD
jgi:regulator of protease activity HflC (stomatin/prohibitin superfamily)